MTGGGGGGPFNLTIFGEEYNQCNTTTSDGKYCLLFTFLLKMILHVLYCQAKVKLGRRERFKEIGAGVRGESE